MPPVRQRLNLVSVQPYPQQVWPSGTFVNLNLYFGIIVACCAAYALHVCIFSLTSQVERQFWAWGKEIPLFLLSAKESFFPPAGHLHFSLCCGFVQKIFHFCCRIFLAGMSDQNVKLGSFRDNLGKGQTPPGEQSGLILPMYPEFKFDTFLGGRVQRKALQKVRMLC